MMTKDEETGEINYTLTLNTETGETEGHRDYQKRIFKIPTSYISENSVKPATVLPSDPIMAMHATAIVYLLPTTIFFYPVLSIFAALFEITLHMWAHRKNKRIKDQTLYYYQSPLHLITKEFCACCKEERFKVKISKLYDQRADKIKKYGLEYVKRIVT